MNQFVPSIEPLPNAPLLERFLYEQPGAWAGAAAIAMVAVVILILANRRGRLGAGGAAAGAILAICGAWVMTARLVTTDRERIDRGTVALIQAAADGDRSAADGILAEDARLHLAGAGSFSMSRDRILDGFDALRRDIRVSDYGILERTKSVDGVNSGRSRVVVRFGFKEGGPTFSSWELAWRREPSGLWRIIRMEALSINGQAPGSRFAGELDRFAR